MVMARARRRKARTSRRSSTSLATQYRAQSAADARVRSANKRTADAKAETKALKQKKRDTQREMVRRRPGVLLVYFIAVAFGVVVMGQVIRIARNKGRDDLPKRFAGVSFLLGAFALFIAGTPAGLLFALACLGTSLSFIGQWSEEMDLVPLQYDNVVNTTAVDENGNPIDAEGGT